MESSVILFPSSGHAIYARKVLGLSGIKCKLIAVPRIYSSQCGVCLSLATIETVQAEVLLTRNGILFEAVHTMDPSDR